MRKTVFLFYLLGMTLRLQAQEIISFASLNTQRIHTNTTGMQVLGAWGAANIVTGVTGYLTADDNEWRSFHQMNTLWGVVNLGIAGAGYLGARKEAKLSYTPADALRRHEANRRLFLLNSGLDGLYIGTGIYLTEHAKSETSHPEVWRGYGKSIALQGIGLLLFDAVMYAAHGRKDRQWYKLLQGVTMTGNGIGLHYTF